LPTLHEHHKTGYGDRDQKQHNHKRRLEGAGTRQFQRAADSMRQTGHDACENDERNAITDTRSVTCSPSHIINIVPVTSVTTVTSLKPIPGSITTGIPQRVDLEGNGNARP